jgi:hypothetical protein
LARKRWLGGRERRRVQDAAKNDERRREVSTWLAGEAHVTDERDPAA